MCFIYLFIHRFVEGFEILHGDHHGLIDTISFLDSLATLAKIGGHHQEREHLAAAALFNWEVNMSSIYLDSTFTCG